MEVPHVQGIWVTLGKGKSTKLPTATIRDRSIISTGGVEGFEKQSSGQKDSETNTDSDRSISP